MKPKLVLILALALFIHLSFGQTMRELLHVLPESYTPRLTKTAKDSLLQFNAYTFPWGDSIETMIGTYSETDDHLVIEYRFTTGQSDFTIFQMRKFFKTDGKPCVIFSRYGGQGRSFHQQELKVLTYQNNTLIEDHTIVLPKTISVRDFFKAGTSEEIIKEHEKNISTSYDLKPPGFDAIEYLAYPADEPEYELLETEVIRFTWDGSGFKRSIGER